MLNQFSELFQTSLKPIEKLVELNMTTANTVAHQQGLLIGSLIDSSLSFNQNMSASTDMTNFFTKQLIFSADVQGQLNEALTDISETLNQSKKNAEVIFSDSFSVFPTNMSQTLVESSPVASKKLIKEKPLSAPKAAVKSAPKAAVKSAPKAAPKNSV